MGLNGPGRTGGPLHASPARIALVLPWAPSVNRVHARAGRGVRLGPAHRAYRELVQVAVHEARRRGTLPRAALAGRLAVAIDAHPPTRARRDLDNLGKATLDALTRAGVWFDDAQVDALTFRRAPVVSGGRLVVVITELAPPAVAAPPLAAMDTGVIALPVALVDAYIALQRAAEAVPVLADAVAAVRAAGARG